MIYENDLTNLNQIKIWLDNNQNNERPKENVILIDYADKWFPLKDEHDDQFSDYVEIKEKFNEHGLGFDEFGYEIINANQYDVKNFEQQNKHEEL